MKNTYLVLILGGEYFAVPVLNVLEVKQKEYVTSVPKSAEHILGVVNFRGDILPVVDIRCTFEMQRLSTEAKFIVIVLELEVNQQMQRFAAVADSVVDVIEVDDAEKIAVPELGLNFDNRYVTGAVRRADNNILLLDVEELFMVNNLIESEPNR